MPPIYFLVQSGLLLLAAYFLGAALACFLRRTIFASASAEAPRSAAAAGGNHGQCWSRASQDEIET